MEDDVVSTVNARKGQLTQIQLENDFIDYLVERMKSKDSPDFFFRDYDRDLTVDHCQVVKEFLIQYPRFNEFRRTSWSTKIKWKDLAAYAHI